MIILGFKMSKFCIRISREQKCVNPQTKAHNPPLSPICHYFSPEQQQSCSAGKQSVVPLRTTQQGFSHLDRPQSKPGPPTSAWIIPFHFEVDHSPSKYKSELLSTNAGRSCPTFSIFTFWLVRVGSLTKICHFLFLRRKADQHKWGSLC